jgi:hypothetical protein
VIYKGDNMGLKKFIFLHIMKTAGTMIREELIRNYGDDKVLIDNKYSLDKIKGTGLINLTNNSDEIYIPKYENFQIICGHFSYKKYKHLNLPFITFLRNPVDRVISHFYNVNNIDFFEFCRKTENTMTYMTGGDLSKYVFVGIFEEMQLTIDKLENLLGVDLKRNVVNKTRVKQKIDAKQINYIKKYNQKDIKLYNEALSIFYRG